VRLPPQDDGETEPWTAPPSRHRRESPIVGELPSTLELVLGNQISIAKEGLHPGLRNRLLRLAAFQNPSSTKLRRCGFRRTASRASSHAPRISRITSGYHAAASMTFARCSPSLASAWSFATNATTVVLWMRSFTASCGRSRRPQLTPSCATRLASWQQPPHLARPSLLRGSSRKRGVNALVLVHRRQLLDQWVERLSTFLDMPANAIGRIGGGRRRPTGRIDVGIIQSLVRKGVVADLVADYGHVIIDECHHLSAHSFEQIARQAKARFVLGLSATVARKDGHHPIIFMQCGPVRHQVNARAQAASRPFEHFVLVQPTAFQPARNPDPDKRIEFQTLYQELIDDQARTRRICEDVIDSVRNGRSPLILTERNDHLDRFETELATRVDHVVVLRAGIGTKQRQAINERLAAIPRQEGRVILATGKYVGGGFDDPRLDTLFLTLPVSWRGTVAQYAGRLHRLSDGKREVYIYDYADLNVPMLARMFDRRCRGYEAIGYTILLPASGGSTRGSTTGGPHHRDVARPPARNWRSSNDLHMASASHNDAGNRAVASLGAGGRGFESSRPDHFSDL
jgi:superfamily II DNA or RNA helicase